MFKRFAVFNVLDDDDKGQKTTEETLKAMQEQMNAMQKSNEDLMKANKGLLKDLQGERQNRQQFQTRFENLSTTVQGVLDKKKADADTDDSDDQGIKGKQNQPKGLAVELDADGNAYVPDHAIEGVTAPLKAVIEDLKGKNETLAGVIQEMAGSNKVQDQFKQTVAAIVGEKPEFSAAHGKLENLRGVINQAVSQFQEQRGLEGFFTPAQVLDLLDGDLKEFQDEFIAANPGIDIERVVRGYESQRDLRSTLSHLSGLAAQTPKLDENGNPVDGKGQSTVGDQFKKVLQKPGTLANSSNQRDGKGNAWENLTKMDALDLLDNMSDADADKIEAALLKEELSDLDSK